MRQAKDHLIGVLGLALALIVSGVALSLASGQEPPATTPANLERDATSETETGPAPVPSAFVDGEGLERTFLTTPLVHAGPEGGQVRLFVFHLMSPASD